MKNQKSTFFLTIMIFENYRTGNSQKVSDMLENETKKMEEKLDLVKKMMDLEKDKRSQITKSN